MNTNVTNNHCNYLDLSIVLQNGKFKFTLFDKRNDFNFEVINYPYLSGNIPKIPSYGVYVSQLVRSCYASSESISNWPYYIWEGGGALDITMDHNTLV